jgi:hypothetical protein
MQKIYNFSINLLLKNSLAEKLKSQPIVSPDVLNLLEHFLRDKIGSDIQILFSNQLASHTSFDIKLSPIEDIFSSNVPTIKVGLSKMSLEYQSQPYARYDKNSEYNYVCHLPIFVRTSSSINATFLPFDGDFIKLLSTSFNEGLCIAFGCGNNDKNKSLFEIDFDCLFNVGKTLGISTFENEDKTENSTAAQTNNIFILPFFSLSAFSAAFEGSNTDMLGKFNDWLRVFRATIDVFGMLNIKYQIKSGLSSWLNTPFTSETANQIKDFPNINGLYEEDLILAESESQLTNLPVQINMFEEATTGIICSFVNWVNDETVVSKVYYPISHDDVDLLKGIETNLRKTNNNVISKCIELDESNENLIIKQLGISNTKLLTN